MSEQKGTPPIALGGEPLRNVASHNTANSTAQPSPEPPEWPCLSCGKPLLRDPRETHKWTHATDACEGNEGAGLLANISSDLLTEFIRDQSSRMQIDAVLSNVTKALATKKAQEIVQALDRPILPVAETYRGAEFDEAVANSPTATPRFQGLTNVGGRSIWVAAAKVGKTTLAMSRMWSLFTGEPFLGEFPTTPLEDDQTILILNYEMPKGLYHNYLERTPLWETFKERILIQNLDSHENPVASDKALRGLQDLVVANNVAAIEVDTLAASMFIGSLNNDNEAIAQLNRLRSIGGDEVDLMIEHHTGKDHTRGSRGSSAIPGWVDTSVYLISEYGDETENKILRFMRVEGRSEGIDEIAERGWQTLTLNDSGFTTIDPLRPLRKHVYAGIRDRRDVAEAKRLSEVEWPKRRRAWQTILEYLDEHPDGSTLAEIVNSGIPWDAAKSGMAGSSTIRDFLSHLSDYRLVRNDGTNNNRSSYKLDTEGEKVLQSGNWSELQEPFIGSEAPSE